MRLAWFTPWPPQQSGVAGRSAAVVPALASGGAGIDVFVNDRDEPDGRAGRAVAAERAAAEAPAPGEVRVQSAHEFLWRHARGQYDLAVYQLGNSRLHEFIWPYAFAFPGLSVLHDTRLHHARARARLSRGEVWPYRAEFSWSHPDVSADAAELVIAGFQASYYYLWPMTRAAVCRARVAAAHTRGAVESLRAAWPDHPIEYIALGYSEPHATSLDRGALRDSLGLSRDHLLFGVFGALTPQKRLPLIMSVFAGLFARRPDARLLLVGAPDARGDIERLARTLGITQAVISIESPDDAAFERAMQAVDVSVNLRWPSAGEMSGPWLQALAAGKPTIVTDLAHQTDIPALDPRTWQPLDPLDRLDGGSGREPVTVAIDLADEEHSLRLAMHRLADDAALRDRLGRAAHAYWAHEHSLERMTADYTRVLEIARTAPEPATVLPAAMSPDPMARARSVLSPFGLPLDALWTGKS